MTLPNRNEVQETGGKAQPGEGRSTSLNDQKQRLVQYAKENGSITRKQAETLLDAGTTKAYRLLKELCDAGKLIQKGNGKQSCYVIP